MIPCFAKDIITPCTQHSRDEGSSKLLCMVSSFLPDLKIYINCTLVNQRNTCKGSALLLRQIINYLLFSLRKKKLSIVSLLVLEFVPLK